MGQRSVIRKATHTHEAHSQRMSKQPSYAHQRPHHRALPYRSVSRRMACLLGRNDCLARHAVVIVFAKGCATLKCIPLARTHARTHVRTQSGCAMPCGALNVYSPTHKQRPTGSQRLQASHTTQVLMKSLTLRISAGAMFLVLRPAVRIARSNAVVIRLPLRLGRAPLGNASPCSSIPSSSSAITLKTSRGVDDPCCESRPVEELRVLILPLIRNSFFPLFLSDFEIELLFDQLDE